MKVEIQDKNRCPHEDLRIFDEFRSEINGESHTVYNIAKHVKTAL